MFRLPFTFSLLELLKDVHQPKYLGPTAGQSTERWTTRVPGIWRRRRRGPGLFGSVVSNVFGFKLLGAAERGRAVQIGKKEDGALASARPCAPALSLSCFLSFFVSFFSLNKTS